MTTKKSTITLISLVAVALFIGTAINPATAVTSLRDESQELVAESTECSLCAQSQEYTIPSGGGCDTCGETVEFAVNYMLENIGDILDDGWYLLKSVDAAILVVSLIVEGTVQSGYTIQLNADELKAYVKDQLETYVGSQIFLITQFLAAIIVISVSVVVYLIDTICGGSGSAQSSPVATPQSTQSTPVSQSTSTQQTVVVKAASAKSASL